MDRCWCGNTELIDYSVSYSCCANCGTLISKKFFDKKIYDICQEDSDLYGSNYWKQKMLKMTGLQTLENIVDLYMKERVVYWLKGLLSYMLPPARVLEVGCGLGQFSYMLKHVGYYQHAYELSPEICAWVEDKLKINIFWGDATQSIAKYEVVAAFDVLEHLDDPIAFLKSMYDKLDEEGVLCIQTPCYDDMLTYENMRVTKPRFIEQLKENEHIYIYSKKSVELLLKKAGFNYIYFEPAFFGDDYDMYLFASKTAIKKNTNEEIDAYLAQQPNGYIIKALISIFDENELNKKHNEELKKQRENHLNDINKLIDLNRDLQQKVNKLQAEREQHLCDINSLMKVNKSLQDENTLLEQESEKRLNDVLTLTEINKSLQDENTLLEEESEKRLNDVLTLTEINKSLQDEKALLEESEKNK